MSPELIGKLVNVGLILLLVGLIILLVLLGLKGMKRGIFRSTYFLLGFAAFYLVCIFTLQPFTDLIYSIDVGGLLSKFGVSLGSLSFTIPAFLDNPAVPISLEVSSVGGMVTELFKQITLAYDATATLESATQLALALSSGFIKFITFLIEVTLLLLLWALALTFFWIICFRFFIPKLARKVVKFKWVSLAESVLLGALSIFMIFSPISSVVNSLNKGYQKGKTGEANNEIVKYVDSALNAYDNSLFSKILLNWTVNEKTGGLTLDAAFIQKITSGVTENAQIGLIDTLYAVAQLGGTASSLLGQDSSGNFTVNVGAAASAETISAIFDAIKNSGLILSVLPVVGSLAVNSNILHQYISSEARSSIDMSTLNWQNEITNIENMALDIINSGVASNFIDEDGNIKSTIDGNALIDFILEEENYKQISKAFGRVDDSELLSFAMPVAVQLVAKSNEQVANYLPTDFEELSSIRWGFEMTTLLDCVYQTYVVCPEIKDFLINQISPQKSKVKMANGGSTGGIGDIIGIIADKLPEVSKIFVGSKTADGKIDETKIGEDGKTKAGDNVKYCLLDLDIIKKLMTKALPDLLLSSGDTFKDSEQDIRDAFANLTGEGDAWRLNFKKELNTLFYSLEPLAEDPATKEALKTLDFAALIPSDLSKFSEDTSKAMAKGLTRMNESEIANAALYPLLKQVITSPDMMDQLSGVGLNADLINLGFERAHVERYVFTEMASLIRVLPKIGTLLNGLGGEDIIATLGENSEVIAYVLDAFYDCKLINPAPKTGDTFEKNANFYGLMSYIFGGAIQLEGLSFKEEAKELVTKWTNSKNEDGDIVKFDGENGKISSVIKTIAESKLLEALEGDIFSGDDVNKKLAELETKYHISSVFTAIGGSTVFSLTMGEFLDKTIESAGIVDPATMEKPKTSFTNIPLSDATHNYWDIEGKKFGKLLTTFGDIEININNLDLEALDDVIGFDKLLHALADSTIFDSYDLTTKENVFTFPKWIYGKLSSSLGTIDSGGTQYSLLADPAYWDTENWGEKISGNDTTLFYKDIMSLKMRADWIGESYSDDTSSIISGKEYYKQPGWYTPAVDAYLAQDSLGKICRIVYHAKSMLTTDILELPADTFNNLLDSINDAEFMRVFIYNIYGVARDSIGGSGSFFDISTVNANYLVTCNNEFSNLKKASADREEELNGLKDLYTLFRKLKDQHVLDGADLDISVITHDLVDEITENYINLNKSHVFHIEGPGLDKDGNPLGSETAFQNMIKAFITKTSLKDSIYNSDSPKDIASSAAYHDGDSKATFIIDTKFSPVEARTPVGLNKQNTYLNEIFNVFHGLVDFGKSDFSSFDFAHMSQEDIDALETILTRLDESEILYDCVPNTLYTSFKDSEFDEFGGLSLADATPFYRYTDSRHGGSTDPDYSRRLIVDKDTDNEINRIMTIVGDLSALIKYTDGKSFTDLSVLSGLVKGDDKMLQTLLIDAKKSEMFHECNEYVTSSTHMTVFEQIINVITSESGLNEYNYGVKQAPQMAAKIKDITALEASGTVYDESLNGYHVKWDGVDKYDSEIIALNEFLATACDSLGGSGSLNMSDLALDKLSPEKVEALMKALNMVDIFNDTLPNFIKSGFENIGLESFTTVNGVNYAYYTLSQKGYGGSLEQVKEGTNTKSDIALISKTLASLADKDSDGNFIGYKDIGSDTESLTKSTALDDILSFVIESRILNTNKNGQFNVMNDLNNLTSDISDDASARGIFMFNLFDKVSVGTDSLADYIRGGNDGSLRMFTLSHILAFNEAQYSNFSVSYEADAIRTLANNTAMLSALNDVASASGGNYIDGIVSAKSSISFLMTNCFQDADENQRTSYLVSEVVKNILDKVLVSEQSGNRYYYYTLFNNPNLISDNTSNISYLSYKSTLIHSDTMKVYLGINETERDGFIGSLDMIPVFTTAMSESAYGSEAEQAMCAALDTMGTSYSARTLFRSEILPLANPILFPSVNTCCGSDGSLMYSNGFTFNTSEPTHFGYQFNCDLVNLFQ